jgi:cytoskeletal protein CcmA (bactofilin family)
MFTKKPERDVASDAFQRVTDRPGSEATPFAERPANYGKSSGPSKLVPSIIGEDLAIIGNVTSKGEIQVDGEIQGDVHCGSLLLGDKSQITGCVVAEDVVVRGRVVGSIRGLRVTLQAQSHVEGDIYHQSLAIEQGAYFEGKSRRSDNPLAAAGQPADKPAAVADKSSAADKPPVESKSEPQTRAAE